MTFFEITDSLDDKTARQVAQQAFEKCHAFHSKKPVGICLTVKTAEGRIQYIPGFNIENSAYASSNHAGLVAVTEMLNRGYRAIESIMIVLTNDKSQQVSLAWLNTLMPYCSNSTPLKVYRDDSSVQSYTVKSFLPKCVLGQKRQEGAFYGSADMGSADMGLSEVKGDIDSLKAAIFEKQTLPWLSAPYSPISKFHVASTIVFEWNGKIYSITRANTEPTPHEAHETSCAEASALAAILMMIDGKLEDIKILAIFVANEKACPKPCGNCRQILMEFLGPEDNPVIYSGNSEGIKEENRFKDIFKERFGLSDLTAAPDSSASTSATSKSGTSVAVGATPASRSSLLWAAAAFFSVAAVVACSKSDAVKDTIRSLRG